MRSIYMYMYIQFFFFRKKHAEIYKHKSNINSAQCLDDSRKRKLQNSSRNRYDSQIQSQTMTEIKR